MNAAAPVEPKKFNRQNAAKGRCTLKAYFSCISCGVHQLQSLYYMKIGRRVGTETLSGMDIIVSGLEFVSAESVPTRGSGEETYNATCAMYVFSDADCYGNGIAFAKVIADNALGPIVENAEVTFNPNSGNKIRTWIWQINREKTRKFVKKYWETV
jgi:hypothetical protein